jgi:hypothetical protein
MLNERGMERDHVKRCSALDFLLSSWPSYICLQLIKYNHSLGFLFCRLYAEFVGYLSARDSFGGSGVRLERWEGVEQYVFLMYLQYV